jgi:hypothetical protein
VVAQRDLRIGDDIGGGFTPKGTVMGFRARLEDGVLVLRKTDGGRRLASGWDALRDRLSTLDRTTWHGLHLWREWPAEEAIAIGAAVRAPGDGAGAAGARAGGPGHGVAGEGTRHRPDVSRR